MVMVTVLTICFILLVIVGNNYYTNKANLMKKYGIKIHNVDDNIYRTIKDRIELSSRHYYVGIKLEEYIDAIKTNGGEYNHYDKIILNELRNGVTHKELHEELDKYIHNV